VVLTGLSSVDLEPGLTGTALRLLVRGLRQRRNRTEILGWIGRVRRDLGRIDDALQSAEEELRNADQPDEPVDARWWRARRREIDAARRAGDHADALASWLTAWCRALAADEFALAEQIASSTSAEPDPALVRHLQTTTQGVRDQAVITVIDGLDGLLAFGLTRSAELTTVVNTLRTRALLATGDLSAATRAADLGLERLGLDPTVHNPSAQSVQLDRWQALALVVRAEVEIIYDPDEAERQLERVLAAPAPPGEAYVLAGRLAEARGAWSAADEAYDQGLNRGVDATAVALLRRRPPRLAVRAARRLRESDPATALMLIEAALGGEFPGDGEFPETEVYLDQAQILERLGRRADASSAYVEAGKRYLWSGLAGLALPLYEQACAFEEATGEAWWWYGEALRLAALQPSNTYDVAVLHQADRAMQRGSDARLPNADFAWTLITQSMIDTELGRTSPDPLVMMERAMLLKPDDALLRCFLATLLRRRGYLEPALADLRRVRDADPTISFGLDQLVGVLLDLGRYDDALQQLERELIVRPGDEYLTVLKAVVLCRQHRLADARQVLSDLPDTIRVVTQRAEVASALEEWTTAQEEFEKVREQSAEGPEDWLRGWAAYRTGRLDEAIENYERLMELPPTNTNYRRDAGQMRLVRGNPAHSDLAVGTNLIRRGVELTTYADELHAMRTAEFDLVRADVAGQPHEADVRALLTELDAFVLRRHADLLAAKPVEGVWGRLWQARTALENDDPGTALTRYLELAETPEIPLGELQEGLMRAAENVFAAADGLVRDGQLEAAQAVWAELDRATPLISAGDELAAALAGRRTAERLARGAAIEPSEVLGLLDGNWGQQALSDSVELFTEDPVSAWRVYDGLIGLAGHEESGDASGTIAAIAAELPFEPAYRLRTGDAPATGSAYAVSALEVLLGPAHHHRAGELKERIRTLRRELTAETGVRIQSVRRTPVASEPGLVQFRLFDQTVRRQSIAPDDADPVGQMVATLAEIVRAQLHRLIGPDDVRLWLSGWNLSHATGPAWDPTDPPQARLRLVRVLRILLREGVPIADRETIVSAFAAVDDAEIDHGPLPALRAVRLALGPQALGWSAEHLMALLPEELEEQFRQGLTPDGVRWELPSERATALTHALRDWLAGLESGDRTVVVRDPRLRVFVWRLAAGDGARRPILAEEELVTSSIGTRS
jgi:tetratricopeptide (TPR) repeat protein